MLTGKKLFIIFIVFILTLYISSADTVTPQTPKALFTRSGFRLAGRFWLLPNKVVEKRKA